MTVALSLLALGAAYLAWRTVGWWWDPHVSRQWRRDQQRAGYRNTFNSITWKWPVKR